MYSVWSQQGVITQDKPHKLPFCPNHLSHVLQGPSCDDGSYRRKPCYLGTSKFCGKCGTGTGIKVSSKGYAFDKFVMRDF